MGLIDVVDQSLLAARNGFDAGYSIGLGYLDSQGFLNPTPPQVDGYTYNPYPLQRQVVITYDNPPPVVDSKSKDILGVAVVLIGIFVLIGTMK